MPPTRRSRCSTTACFMRRRFRGYPALWRECLPPRRAPRAFRVFRQGHHDAVAPHARRVVRRGLRGLPPKRPARRLHPPRGYARVGDLGLSPWLCRSRRSSSLPTRSRSIRRNIYEKGLEIVTVPTRRMSPAALPSTVKSLNYLNNIMGKMEARQAGALEASCSTIRVMWLNARGITSLSSTRAPSSRRRLAGCAQGHHRTRSLPSPGPRRAHRESNLTRYDVWCADECFLTGTGAEVIAAVKLDVA